MDLTKGRVVGGNCLPRKLTTGAEATNVATEHELLPSRQLLPKTRPDKRVDPIDGAGFRNGATSGYGETEGAVKRHGARQVSRDIYVLVPIACAGKKIEGCGARGTLAAARPDCVSTPRFDDG